jgi:hypothetical protein
MNDLEKIIEELEQEILFLKKRGNSLMTELMDGK